MVNFELYKMFVILADEKDLFKASNVLHMSPSSIQKYITNLEQVLQSQLFVRDNVIFNLTDIGLDLYKKLKKPINEIIDIDTAINSIKNIDVGSNSLLLNKVFEKCISQFYFKYPKVNLNINKYETFEMLEMLSNGILNIVFSKKVSNLSHSNLQFLKLGYLHDIFVANSDSDFKNKVLDTNDFTNQIIFIPRSDSQIVNNLSNLVNIDNLNLKYTSYKNILKLISSDSGIALVTKEFLNNSAYRKYNLVELNTNFVLEPVEFGVYLNNDSFKELADFVQILKSHFFFKEFWNYQTAIRFYKIVDDKVAYTKLDYKYISMIEYLRMSLIY